MAQRSMIYENQRGEIKHYDIFVFKEDADHFYARHDDQQKTFRHDAVLEWLNPDDDPGSHLAYWRDHAATPRSQPKPQRETARVKRVRAPEPKLDLIRCGGCGGSRRADAETCPNCGHAGKAKRRRKSRTVKAPSKKRIQWRSFWLGVILGWVVPLGLAIAAGVIGAIAQS